ncbi:MAG: hypothetical protein R3C61_08090 [Bacteroidia bacterium]
MKNGDFFSSSKENYAEKVEWISKELGDGHDLTSYQNEKWK